MRIAYFDCFSGISGDMTLGALLDLGVPLEWLIKQLADIPLKGFDISIKKDIRQGIHANRLQMAVSADPPSRNYADIKKLIQDSPLSAWVKQTGLAIFDTVAQAEAKIHQVLKQQVHFHEIGAMDSIIDILGTVLCLDYLHISQVAASKIPLGKGFVECRHGILPVPAPATLEILKDVPVFGSGIEQELVTPTGAAIIATLAERFGDLPEMAIEKIGYGAGQHDSESRPNLLRIIIGRPVSAASNGPTAGETDTVVIVETCIDDMNPEIFGYLMDRLFEDGALDVYWIPVFMKKNRPGTMVQVLCNSDRKPAILQRILSETTSIGLRYYEARRQTLARETIMIATRYGQIQVKRIIEPENRVRIVPEYEACRKIACDLQIPVKEVYAEINRAASVIALTKTGADCKDEP